MNSIVPEVWFNLAWLMGSSIAVFVGGLLAWKLGLTLGKVNASAQMQVMEERLQHQQAQLAQKNTDVIESQKKIDNLREQAEQHQDDLRDRDIRLAELNAQLVATNNANEEKLTFVTGAKDQLKMEFQSVAQLLLEEKSVKFSEQSKASLSHLLLPLKDQLTNFSKQVSDGYDKDLRDRVSLLKEIDSLKTINNRMSGEALNLTRALKGDNKLQGNWGEMVLERVFEMSGLQNGREYLLQPAHKNQEGALLRPDAVVNLPDGKSAVVDSKVSLKHWTQVVGADSHEIAEQAMLQHIDSIKNHIKNLSSKRYEDLPDITSLDFVLMFVPIEAAFIKALDADPELYDLANRKNIMLVCPSTLLVTLKAIRHGWQQDRQNKNAQQIAQQAGALHDQFVLFVGALDDVGDKISKANESYETAHKRLVSGKGNLVNRVVQLEKLGAKTKKVLVVAAGESEEMVD